MREKNTKKKEYQKKTSVTCGKKRVKKELKKDQKKTSK